jgi:hypothetical protein
VCTVATMHPDTHMHLSQGPDWDHTVHCIMTQLSMKTTLKCFGDRGVTVVSNELSQLHRREMFGPVNPAALSREEYDQVLQSHLFLKEKCNLSVKGRLVAGGSK